jgi:hypothetical protein
MKNTDHMLCRETQERMHQALDIGQRQLPAKAQEHLLHCPTCLAKWADLRRLEDAAFHLGAAEYSELCLPSGLHDRIMNAVTCEDLPKAQNNNRTITAALFPFWASAAAVAAILIGAVYLWHSNHLSEPNASFSPSQLNALASSSISISAIRVDLESLSASTSIKNVQLDLTKTAHNMLAPAMSFGRLIDRDFDSHRAQLLAGAPAR